MKQSIKYVLAIVMAAVVGLPLLAWFFTYQKPLIVKCEREKSALNDVLGDVKTHPAADPKTVWETRVRQIVGPFTGKSRCRSSIPLMLDIAEQITPPRYQVRDRSTSFISQEFLVFPHACAVGAFDIVPMWYQHLCRYRFNNYYFQIYQELGKRSGLSDSLLIEAAADQQEYDGSTWGPADPDLWAYAIKSRYHTPLTETFLLKNDPIIERLGRVPPELKAQLIANGSLSLSSII